MNRVVSFIKIVPYVGRNPAIDGIRKQKCDSHLCSMALEDIKILKEKTHNRLSTLFVVNKYKQQ